MNKIAYNNKYGGFGLSNKAILEICKRKGISVFFYKEEDSAQLDDWDNGVLVKISEEEALNLNEFKVSKCAVDCGERFSRKDPIYKVFSRHFIWEPFESRHDPILIQVIEELGAMASGDCADLRIFETESNLYRIDEYDGLETVITPEMDISSYIKIEVV